MPLARHRRLLVAALVALASLAVAPDARASVSFQPATDLPTADGGALQAVLAGDFDADGHRDVLTARQRADGEDLLANRYGDGDGGFGFAHALSTRMGEFRAAATGELDGTAGDEIAVLHDGPDGPELLVLDPVLPAGPAMAVNASAMAAVDAHHLTVGDYFADSRDEIVVNTSAGALGAYDGQLSPFPAVAALGGTGAPGPLVGFESQSGGGANGDRHLDLVTTAMSGGAIGNLWFENARDPDRLEPRTARGGAPELTADGDFDGDGRRDGAFSAHQLGVPQLHVYKATRKTQELAGDAAALAAGDFTGDGADDIAVLRAAGGDTFYYDIDTNHDQPTPLPASQRAGVGAVRADAADFDEDGRADLLTAHADGTVKLHISDSDDYAGPTPTAPPFTTDTTPTATFTAGTAGSQFRCRLDGGTWETCDAAAGYTPASALTDGEHTVQVMEKRDDRTFWSLPGAPLTVTVDTVAPAAPEFTSTPGAVAYSPRFTYTGEAGASFSCRVDDAAFAPCGHTFMPPGMTDGEHTVEVRQHDRAGNGSPAASYTFTRDTTAPAAPTLLAGPQPTTTDRSVRFEFAGEPGAGYWCAFDGGDYQACASPVSYDQLALGAHVFKVRQSDAAGNSGPARETRFTVVAPQPQVPVDPQPRTTAVRLVTLPEMTVDGSSVTVGCKPDQGTLRSCTVDVLVRTGGKLVGVGTGSADANGAVRVKLTRRGRTLVRRLGGVKVRARLRAVTADGTVLTASARVRLLPRRVLAVPTDGLFASGESSPVAAGERYVRRVARQLAGAKRVTCVGHTDSIGSRSKNRRLGLARAKAVCKLLRQAGVRAKLVASSGGETRPRASNRSRHGRARNRRVELVVGY